MVLKIKHFVILVTIVVFASCKKQPTVVSKVTGKQIEVDSSLQSIDSIEAYVLPYRNRINEVLDSTLAHAPKVITKEDGKYNTSAGNLMADIVFSEAAPIFKSRTGKNIDFVLLNHGGIRSIISEGKVTARTAYEIMPFENSIVVVELRGTSILDMITYLRKDSRPHPVSGIQLTLGKANGMYSLKVQGEPFNVDRTYNVATSNYLLTGGDNMFFFEDALQLTDTDYLIRNALIDYFKKVDTLTSKIDNRLIKL